MKYIIRLFTIALSFALFVQSGYAEQVHYKNNSAQIKSTAAGCLPGSNYKWLEINNVRTRINTGGDMWWDFEQSQYEIPKGSGKKSLFAAALWVGGIDINGQLKLAAHRYRQVGIDFWPGPLTVDGTASIEPETCAAYDKIWEIKRSDVDEFMAWWDDGQQGEYEIPRTILEYPGNGTAANRSHFLAPFFDRDNDGIYDPRNDGDYPYYDVSNELCHTNVPTAEGNGILVDQVLKGDGTLWWVFNDKGNIHTETKGSPVGFEIRAQAFAFTTNDEVNDMTFYSYEIINRSTYELTGTYFSQWTDTDLGDANDDYVGCDVMRGLGYCYNADDNDGAGQSWTYGNQPPAVGIDFFQGPYMDGDGFDNPSFYPVYDEYHNLAGPSFFESCDIVVQDSTMQSFDVNGVSQSVMVNSAAINGVNFGNGIVDDERFGMRRFVYHNNSNSGVPWYMTDPEVAPEYYNFLRGIWKDGTKMIYGGNGHESAGGMGPECDFMFPGETDICNWGTRGIIPYTPSKNWTEVTAGNPPNDRRFMHSAGPFRLLAGSVNYITVGIPWAQASTGGAQASVKKLQGVDDKCQSLFDNCFRVISGPNAPDITIRELDNKLIVYLTNRKTPDAGNNYNESYQEVDPRIQAPPGESWDSLYKFEGYKVYQLKSPDVTVADLYNNDKARLVYQCDVKNNVRNLVNFTMDQNIGFAVPREEVNGLDKGVQHSFILTEDAFGGTLINHKKYYFLAIAYAYNNYKSYNPTDPTALDGQQQPYLPGRKNIKTYTAIPHVPIGTVSAKAVYGPTNLVVTRIAGNGNGGNYLELSQESIDEIMSKKIVDSVNVYGSEDYPIAYHAKYEPGKGPITISVIDPLNVKAADYSIVFDSMFNVRTLIPGTSRDTTISSTRWKIIDNNSGEVYRSDTTIDRVNEQMFLKLGISLNLNQIFYPGYYFNDLNESVPALENNGFLGAEIIYSDSSKPWLTFVPDIDGISPLNWIRAGVQHDQDNALNDDFDWNSSDAHKWRDPFQTYETVLQGTWAPYCLAASGRESVFGPAYLNSQFVTLGDYAKIYSLMKDLASVNIVFTSDKSKWTRCVVVEESSDKTTSEGKALRFDFRKHRSVNVNGDTAVVSSDPMLNSDYIAAYGMSWFPGYAINIETGERLNIIFGENSSMTADNGRDMLWNPSLRFIDENQDIVFGGMHYIYVLAHTANKKSQLAGLTSNLEEDAFDNPAYDGCAHFIKVVTKSRLPNLKAQAAAFQFSNIMWTAMPIAYSDQLLNNDLTIKLRVAKPYERYHSTSFLTGDNKILHNDNNYWPMYNFSTVEIATDTADIVKRDSDLDKIAIVPNPYNAYSGYETNQLDNRVKIVNLPSLCDVSIYSVNGALIRKLSNPGAAGYLDWDLKNFAGIPISGGVYLVHIKTSYGERTIKWFGALRPIDLNAF